MQLSAVHGHFVDTSADTNLTPRKGLHLGNHSEKTDPQSGRRHGYATGLAGGTMENEIGGKYESLQGGGLYNPLEMSFCCVVGCWKDDWL